MDNINCLKKLIEDIVNRQDDSLVSLNNLCRKTETVSSDISNLINSLQMIGNRQFAENRVQDDDLARTVGPLSKHQKNISISSSRQRDDHSSSYEELNLGSILLQAIELLPPSEKDDAGGQEHVRDDNEYDQEIDTRAKFQQISDDGLSSVIVHDLPAPISTRPSPPPPPPPPLPLSMIPPPTSPIPASQLDARASLLKEIVERRQSNKHHQPAIDAIDKKDSPQATVGRSQPKLGPPENRVQENSSQASQKKRALSMDQNRITDILKRYSLYDDDDDDDDESE